MEDEPAAELFSVALAGEAARVRALLEQGDLDPNSASNDGLTALHAASARGHVDVATVLLEHGASPGGASVGMLSPLHSAAWNGHSTVVDLLLSSGASSNVIDGQSGQTPLHHAVHAGCYGAARLLTAAGASLSLKCSREATPLMTCLESCPPRERRRIARLLVSRGADVEALDALNRAELERILCDRGDGREGDSGEGEGEGEGEGGRGRGRGR